MTVRLLLPGCALGAAALKGGIIYGSIDGVVYVPGQ